MSASEIMKIVVDVAMLAISALIIFMACKNGFVKSFFNFSKVILSILITYLLRGFAASACERLFVKNWFAGNISEKFAQKVQQSGGSVNFDSLFDSLPQIVRNLIPKEELQKQFESFIGTSEQSAIELGTKIEEMLTSIVSTLIGCVLLFLIAFAVLSLLAFLLEKIAEAPVLKQLNFILGLLWGVACSYVVMSLITCILILFIDSSFIKATKVLQFFYDHGLFTGFN